MCARLRAVLATTAESAFFFVGAFSLFCPAAAQSLQHRRRVFVARIRGFSFSVFTGGSRASCCERCVFFLFWKGVLRFGGTAGLKKARKELRKAGFRFVSWQDLVHSFCDWRRGGDGGNHAAVCGVGGVVGLFDGSAVACSARARTCSTSEHQRIDYWPGDCICHVIHGARVDIHYPSSWCYPL